VGEILRKSLKWNSKTKIEIFGVHYFFSADTEGLICVYLWTLVFPHSAHSPPLYARNNVPHTLNFGFKSRLLLGFGSDLVTSGSKNRSENGGKGKKFST
jgi:hypothetical protein